MPFKACRVIDECSPDVVKENILGKGVEGYDFVAVYVKHPRCCENVDDLKRRAIELSGGNVGVDGHLSKTIWNEMFPPSGVPDIILDNEIWQQYAIGRIPKWIDPDSTDPILRQISEKALADTLGYFAYLNVKAVLVPLRGIDHGNLARIITSYLHDNTQFAPMIWMEVPIVGSCPAEPEPEKPPSKIPEGWEGYFVMMRLLKEEPLPKRASNDPWEWVYSFRTSCHNDFNLGIVLELTPDLPQSAAVIDRWRGEPLRALKFNTTTFLTKAELDQDGYSVPYLSDAHVEVAKKLFQMKCIAMVEGPQLHGPPAEMIREATKKWLDLEDAKLNEQMDNESAEQPVNVNVSGSIPGGAVQMARAAAAADVDAATSSTTSSAVKTFVCVYSKYLKTIYKEMPPRENISLFGEGFDDFLQNPLQPLANNLESLTYEMFEKDQVKYNEYRRAFELVLATKFQEPLTSNLVVMVLGAGRGPLVTICYDILKNIGRFANGFKLYAVEKNPCAVVTLNRKRVEEWNNEVEVVQADMREFQAPDKADIVVSELLGSFGDNELSPECLDGALHLMKEDCICIPQSYTSFIGPIQSPRLHDKVRDLSEFRKHIAAFETAYVVRPFNQFEIAPPKQLFRFDHPNFEESPNDRYAEVHFVARESAEIMGFVGYFTTKLFGNIGLSIVPETHTPEMFSWFPILFPLTELALVKKGERIRFRIWRQSSETHVWYEWQLVEPVCMAVANSNGRSHAIRLT